MQEDNPFLQILMVSGAGSVIGSVIRYIQKPQQLWRRAFLEAVVALFVGTLAGGVSHEYFSFGPWVTSSAAAVGAYLSDAILRSIEAQFSIFKWDQR